jgi:Oligosaccharide biosynthesis protein Alg14 like
MRRSLCSCICQSSKSRDFRPHDCRCPSLTVDASDLQFLGLPSPRLVYVETFARVRTLSQTGKLLRPIVDRYVLVPRH